MGSFEDIRLQWAGKDYVIPARRELGAIARVEDVLTLNEVQRFSARGAVPTAKIAMAFGSLLRYAGATFTDEEVYAGMFGGAGTSGDAGVAATSALVAILMRPYKHVEKLMAEEEKEAARGNAVPTATASSKRRTRSRSARGK